MVTIQRAGLAGDSRRNRPTETTLKIKKTKQINKPTIKSCPWGGTTPGTSMGCNQPAVNQLCRKGLGVLKDKMNLETVPAAKASSTRGCVRESITCRLRVDMLFCCPVLECCVLCWVPQHRNVDVQERAQQRGTQVIKGLESLSHEERLTDMGTCSPEQRRLREESYQNV